jgi:DNA-binding Lrp family transcriptional regulator
MAGTSLTRSTARSWPSLQADGRMTNVELASRVGISAPPCLRRVRGLEEAGYIRGYHADINPRELGFEVQVFAMVRLNSARPRPIWPPSRRAAATGRWSANATC